MNTRHPLSRHDKHDHDLRWALVPLALSLASLTALLALAQYEPGAASPSPAPAQLSQEFPIGIEGTEAIRPLASVPPPLAASTPGTPGTASTAHASAQRPSWPEEDDHAPTF